LHSKENANGSQSETEVSYVFAGRLGEPLVEANEQAQVTWWHQLEGFGDGSTVSKIANVASPPACTLKFPGMVKDSTTGLWENWFRYYDPEGGRYLQAEPLYRNPMMVRVYAETGIVMNPYAYVANNPVLFIDPSGLTSIYYNVERNELLIDPEQRGRLKYYMPVSSSGRGEFMNKKKCENTKNKGPIPSGDYKINSNELSSPNIIHKIIRRFSGDWGDWRVPLHPLIHLNNGRDNFFLHGGDTPGSAGCIDVAGGLFGDSFTDQLMRDILNDPDGETPVIVR
jgi:RHS repeat-associated protein